MTLLKKSTSVAAATLALMLQFCAPGAPAAADLLAQSKTLALPAKSYPELTQINASVASLIANMEVNTNQLREYRKAKIRATDRRYSALTREFNRSRSRLTEIERKLDKAPSLDVNRFSSQSGGDRGSSSSDIRERAMSAEKQKYEQAKASLRQSLKTLSAHYDQQLREIAKLR